MSTTLKVCPQCGSPGVDYSTLAGGAAECRGCRWKGGTADLLAIPGSAEVNDSATLTDMLNDVRRLLSGTLGLPYLKFLMKWGFLTGDMANPAGTIDRKAFARYMAAIGRTVLTAVLEERSRAEAERAALKAGPN
jgi:hypothetical protein